MLAEQSANQRLLASRYNKPIGQLPTYTQNKYRYIGELLPRLLPQEQSGPLQVVEFGCGNRGLAETYILPKLHRDGMTYVGVDSNIGFDPAPHVIGDIAFSPLASSCADAVLCLDVIEHMDVPNIHRVLAEIGRIAKPNAPVLISVPSLYNLDRFCIPSIQFGTHVTKQTPQEWLDLVGQYISITETMGVGILEIIPFLPQFLKLLDPAFPMSIISSLYNALKQLDLGRLDPPLHAVGLNRIPHVKEYCDDFCMIGIKIH